MTVASSEIAPIPDGCKVFIQGENVVAVKQADVPSGYVASVRRLVESEEELQDVSKFFIEGLSMITKLDDDVFPEGTNLDRVQVEQIQDNKYSLGFSVFYIEDIEISSEVARQFIRWSVEANDVAESLNKLNKRYEELQEFSIE